MNKYYYQIRFNNASSLNIGSGESVLTDKDLIRDFSGKPYIPGTSLAGVFRSYFSEDKANKYFGNEQSDSESSVITYDATIVNDDYKTSFRDMVAIDEKYGVALDGAKFDFEVLQPGSSFITFLEVNDSEIGDEICQVLLNGHYTIGAKTTRGLGAIDNIKIKKICFELPSDKDKWLDFDIYNNECWKDAQDIEKQDIGLDDNCIVLDLGLRQVSPLIIRSYTTDVKDNKAEQPDSKQLSYFIQDKQKAIIPGTSWAGIFRHQMKKMNKNHDDSFFGKNDNAHTKSKILFSESILENSSFKNITRNSIDRFKGGASDKALFTEQICFDGNTKLLIKIDKSINDDMYNALCASICDLDNGIISVGGESSVGRGLFKVESVNDKPVDDNCDLYNLLKGERQ